VQGHDHQTLLELKDYVQNTLKLGEPVVLRQMPGLGKTLIEKFEREAETIELVFVLLTPDDKGAAPRGSMQELRQFHAILSERKALAVWRALSKATCRCV
jgi:predicted nucleotide-binding protein